MKNNLKFTRLAIPAPFIKAEYTTTWFTLDIGEGPLEKDAQLITEANEKENVDE